MHYYVKFDAGLYLCITKHFRTHDIQFREVALQSALIKEVKYQKCTFLKVVQNILESKISRLFLQVKEEAKKREMKKYNVKPPRDLRSKFELKQEAKRDAEKQAEKEKLRKEEEERIAVCFIYQSCVLQIIPLVHIFKSNIFIGSQLK